MSRERDGSIAVYIHMGDSALLPPAVLTVLQKVRVGVFLEEVPCSPSLVPLSPLLLSRPPNPEALIVFGVVLLPLLLLPVVSLLPSPLPPSSTFSVSPLRWPRPPACTWCGR
jgi:hypothetical protein